MRQAVLEAGPDRRSRCDIIGVIETPVRAGEYLLRNIRIYDNRIDWDIREIAALIQPGEGATSSSARHLEEVTRCRGRVGIKAADSSIANRKIRGRR